MLRTVSRRTCAPAALSSSNTAGQTPSRHDSPRTHLRFQRQTLATIGHVHSANRCTSGQHLSPWHLAGRLRAKSLGAQPQHPSHYGALQLLYAGHEFGTLAAASGSGASFGIVSLADLPCIASQTRPNGLTPPQRQPLDWNISSKYYCIAPDGRRTSRSNHPRAPHRKPRPYGREPLLCLRRMPCAGGPERSSP